MSYVKQNDDQQKRLKGQFGAWIWTIWTNRNSFEYTSIIQFILQNYSANFFHIYFILILA